MTKLIVQSSEPIRLNKYLAQSKIASRREADKLIEGGSIRLNGAVCTNLGIKVSDGDTIEVSLKLSQDTFIVNKPPGYVSDSFSSKDYPAAATLLPTDFHNLPVLGRLDADSRGLVVFSSDGVLAKQIIGENSETEKEYLVKVKGVINEERIAKLQFGLSLDGQKLKRAEVEQIDSVTLRFVLREGKNRQIRRMCEKVGLDVTDLFRVRIGSVTIGDLSEGAFKRLSRDDFKL